MCRTGTLAPDLRRTANDKVSAVLEDSRDAAAVQREDLRAIPQNPLKAGCTDFSL